MPLTRAMRSFCATWVRSVLATATSAPSTSAVLDAALAASRFDENAPHRLGGSGEKVPATPRSFYWKTPNAAAVRQGDWKLIGTKAKREVQLYDLMSDPYETKDLAPEHPERVLKLKALLKEYAARDR